MMKPRQRQAAIIDYLQLHGKICDTPRGAIVLNREEDDKLIIAKPISIRYQYHQKRQIARRAALSS